MYFLVLLLSGMVTATSSSPQLFVLSFSLLAHVEVSARNRSLIESFLLYVVSVCYVFFLATSDRTVNLSLDTSSHGKRASASFTVALRREETVLPLHLPSCCADRRHIYSYLCSSFTIISNCWFSDRHEGNRVSTSALPVLMPPTFEHGAYLHMSS